MNCRSLVSNSFNPYFNLALEQYLFRVVNNDTWVLYLWQNDNTIVVGRNQNIDLECKKNEFLNQGGKIARRLSGGGAVYHDLGNLNYSIICKTKDCSFYIQKSLIKDAMADFGLFVESNERNDFLIEGKKISGFACYNRNEICCVHGTLLVDCNIKKMNTFLTPERSKLERNCVKSVASRVRNLSQLDPAITVDRVKQAILNEVKSEPLTSEFDYREIEKYQSFFLDRNWIYGVMI